MASMSSDVASNEIYVIECACYAYYFGQTCHLFYKDLYDENVFNSFIRVPTPVGISGKIRELSSVIPDREIVGNSIYFVLSSGKCVRRNFSLN